MKITVDTGALERIAKLASDVADKKATNEILRRVLVKVTDGALSLSATNLTTSATATMLAIGGGRTTDGELAIDAASFHAAVKGFNGETSTISSDDKLRLNIESGASKIALPGALAEAMPEIPAVDGGKLHEIDATGFARAIRRGAYPVDLNGNTGSQIRGAIVETTGTELVVCGVSGHRLAEQRMPCNVPVFAAVVDASGLARVVAALEGHAGPARIGLQGGYFAIAFGNTSVLVKLTGDTRVPYERVLDASVHKNVATVDREALMRAARLASLVSDQMSEKSLDSFKIGISDGKLFVRNSHAVKGDASTEIEMDKPGKAISVGLTWRYLTEALSHVDSDKVSVGFGTDVDPILIWPTGQDGQKALIMVRR